MKHLRSSFFLFIFLTVLTSGNAWDDGLIVIYPPPSMPHPPYSFAPLAVKYHHVTVQIVDQVAVTQVDQVFYNPAPVRLEGTYLFPIPKGAQIDRFAMDIDGKMIDAELLDAGKARQIYEDIVRRMRDPALLEYAGQGLFRVHIFPIEPHSEKHIKLSYTQVLRQESNLMKYVYPLNTEKFSAQPVDSVSIKVELTGNRNLQSIYSPSHAVEVRRPDARRAIIGFEANHVLPDADFQLFFSFRPDGDVGLNLLAFNDGVESDGGYFLLLASPSARLAGEQIVQKDVVFVLDTSGSMADGGKLDQAKRALNFCLQNLNRGDRFEVVRFSTESESLFQKLVPADKEHLDKAAAFVKDLRPIGGTAIDEALAAAVSPAASPGQPERPYIVVFLTDGRPTVGATDETQILDRVKRSASGREVRVFCFGIGTDINTHLLDRLSEETRGASQYVLPQEDIEISVSNFYAKISQPALANPRLEVSGSVRMLEMYPSDLPDLFKGEQLMVFGRYKGSGTASLTLTGSVNGRARTFTYPAEFPDRATAQGFIPRLWATRRVGFLLDQIRLHGENNELRDEITRLARQYGIITPYTAYLIVQDETRRHIPIASQTLQNISRREDLVNETLRMYNEMGNAKSGYGAVGGAQTNSALKSAEQVGAPAQANAYALRGQQAMDAAVQGRVDQVINAQQSRYINGRNFYQNGDQWIDANVQSQAGARIIQIKFNSPEYFDLMSKHPDMPQWLSVGRNVQVVLGNTIYQIVE
ncbi:MAG: VIT and VWA domain-containing protein [Acidobacteriota bacterium]